MRETHARCVILGRSGFIMAARQVGAGYYKTLSCHLYIYLLLIQLLIFEVDHQEILTRLMVTQIYKIGLEI